MGFNVSTDNRIQATSPGRSLSRPLSFLSARAAFKGRLPGARLLARRKGVVGLPVS